jgi:hypothetical protein
MAIISPLVDHLTPKAHPRSTPPPKLFKTHRTRLQNGSYPINHLNVKMSSQPGLKDAYTTPGNPATTNPSELRSATSQFLSNAQSSDAEPPVSSSHHTQSEGTFSSLGQGVRGGGRDSDWKTEEEQGRHNELDAEQMAAPGEGRIRDAVVGDASEQGRSGNQVDLASDLER